MRQPLSSKDINTALAVMIQLANDAHAAGDREAVAECDAAWMRLFKVRREMIREAA